MPAGVAPVASSKIAKADQLAAVEAELAGTAATEVAEAPRKKGKLLSLFSGSSRKPAKKASKPKVSALAQKNIAPQSVLDIAVAALPAAALMSSAAARQVAGIPLQLPMPGAAPAPVARKISPVPDVAPETTPEEALVPPATKALRGPRHSLLRRVVGLVVVSISLGSAALWQVQSQGADKVTEEEEMSRQVAFAELRDMQLQSIPKGEASLAFAQMQLQQEDRQALGDLLAESAAASRSDTPLVGSTGSVRLARMILRDTHRSDGDVIAVMSAGFRQEITLTSMPQALVVPVDDTLIVQLLGVTDGSGGGITIGVRGADDEVLMPIMRKGQILSLPIAR